MIALPVLSTRPLEAVRIATAAVVLCVYGLLGSDFLLLYGPQGWLDPATARAMDPSPWVLSVLFHVQTDAQAWAFLAVFLLADAALLLGWRTAWVKWLVLLGQISLVHRNPAIQYGVDNILSGLLVLLCLAPVGRDWSLDRARALRRLKLSQGLAAWAPPPASSWAAVTTGLIQLQMAVFFFWSGAEKLRGDTWWDGIALWRALVNQEFTPAVLGLFAHQFWLVNLLTYATVGLELAFAFLVWGRRTRPWLLGGAVALHLGIAVFMGLWAFSAAMIAGHLAFLRPEWLDRLAQAWRERAGAIEMIYDGNCRFCVRSMAWFLAFDFGRQVTVRDFRRDPSPVVSDEAMERALHAVVPGRPPLPGFDAYRHTVIRVPGMWWMVPLFHVPVLSAAVGRPLYLWIARHRGTLATCAVPGEAAGGPSPR
jgi:predicted DCC family thiol-disulfide oxidoreductase YuxK